MNDEKVEFKKILFKSVLAIFTSLFGDLTEKERKAIKGVMKHAVGYFVDNPNAPAYRPHKILVTMQADKGNKIPPFEESSLRIRFVYYLTRALVRGYEPIRKELVINLSKEKEPATNTEERPPEKEPSDPEVLAENKFVNVNPATS